MVAACYRGFEMRKRAAEFELPFIGVTALGRLIAGSARPEHGVTGGFSANANTCNTPILTAAALQ